MRRLFRLVGLPLALVSSAVALGIGSSHGGASASVTSGASASVTGDPTGPNCPVGGVPPTSKFSPPSPEVIPYLFNDDRLGPEHLPRHGPVGHMLDGYVRFAGMGPENFLDCYWRVGQNYANWRYPKDYGFVVVDGRPVEHTVDLFPGQEVDLFGNPGNPANPAANKGGQFLAPAGTPYAERALPPTNLDTYAASAPFNYYLYRVDKEFSVIAGPIAPWFDQPGGGTQDYLAGTTGPGLPPNPGIANLVNQGYVQQLPVGQSNELPQSGPTGPAGPVIGVG